MKRFAADARLLCLAAAAAAAAQAAVLRPLQLAGLTLDDDFWKAGEDALGKMGEDPLFAFGSNKTVYEEIKRHIESQLSHIEDFAEMAQQSLESLYDNISTCGNSSENGTGDAEELAAEKGNLSASHKACRANESNQTEAAAACNETLQAKMDLNKTACDALADLKDRVNPDMCHEQDEQGVDESYGDWLQRLKTKINETVKNYTKLEEACSNATAEVLEQEGICNPLAAELNATRAECDRTQAELENTTCSLVTASNRTCNAHISCLTDARDALQTQLPSFQEAEANWTAEWRTLEQMLCLVDTLINGTHDQIEECRTTMHNNTDHLNLNHSKAPANDTDPDGHPLCSPLSPDPCSAAYLNEEYSGLPENVDTQPCNACPQVPPEHTPTSVQTAPPFLMASVPTGTASLHRSDQAWNELLGQLHGLVHRPKGKFF